MAYSPNMEDLAERFAVFDTVGDKKIEPAILGAVLRAFGVYPTEAELKKFVKELDGRRITLEEVIPIYQKFDPNRPVERRVQYSEVFKMFDRDQNGIISSADLRYLLTSLGEKMTEEEVDQLLHGIEEKDGNIHYEEMIYKLINYSIDDVD